MGILLLKVVSSPRHLFKRASATRKFWELKEVRECVETSDSTTLHRVQALCSIPDHGAKVEPETFRDLHGLRLR